jgi:hypothetical protein
MMCRMQNKIHTTSTMIPEKNFQNLELLKTVKHLPITEQYSKRTFIFSESLECFAISNIHSLFCSPFAAREH